MALLLANGDLFSGSFNPMKAYKKKKKEAPKKAVQATSPEETCGASKSIAVSGATESSHTNSVSSDNCH
jgi:hypothetical protein